MKTNLKTCPDSPWKLAFEKELREILRRFDAPQVDPTDIHTTAWRAGRKDLLKEILG